MNDTDRHALRARTLVNREDPRIEEQLNRTPKRKRPASPDQAYWQAALTIAAWDARRELHQRAKRHRPRWWQRLLRR